MRTVLAHVLHGGNFLLRIFDMLQIPNLLPRHNFSCSLETSDFPGHIHIVSELEYGTLLDNAKYTLL
jgi:hypothetical protein